MTFNLRISLLIVIIIAFLAGGFYVVTQNNQSFFEQQFKEREVNMSEIQTFVNESSIVIKATEIARARGIITENSEPSFSSVQLYSNPIEAFMIESLSHTSAVSPPSFTAVEVGPSFSISGIVVSETPIYVTSMIFLDDNDQHLSSFKVYLHASNAEFLGYSETWKSSDDAILLDWLALDTNQTVDDRLKVIQSEMTKRYESIDIEMPSGSQYTLIGYNKNGIQSNLFLVRELKESRIEVINALSEFE